jgi:hypothetical protein
VRPTQQSLLASQLTPPLPQLVTTSSHLSVPALQPLLQQSAAAVQLPPFGTQALPHLPSLPHARVQH